MATQIMPERFSAGDFTAWLRQFERCAVANAWDTDTRLLKLPALWHGPAAAYFESLAEGVKDTLAHLLTSLKRCFTPAVSREIFYRDFDQEAPEDPSLYLWRLKDLLRNAEPDLSDEAFDALLRIQFMKDLPFNIRIKLLESDPTPNLSKMVSFVQRYRALDELAVSPTAPCAAVHHAAIDPAVPQPGSHVVAGKLPKHPHEPRQQRLDELEHLISNMAYQQATLSAAVSAPHSPPKSGTYPTSNRVRCFYCQDEGHVVCDCRRRRGAARCTVCRDWGHSPQNCANICDPQLADSKLQYSLSSQKGASLRGWSDEHPSIFLLDLPPNVLANPFFLVSLVMVCNCLCLLTRDP